LKKQIYVIAGATATGKTAYAIELAKKIGGEIISADSMQVYREMNIGTAKPTHEEMQNIPHHLIDIVNPNEQFSAAQFQTHASVAIEQILSRGKIPIVAGGTGFYINALLYGAEFSSENNPQEEKLREEFFALAKKHSPEFLHEKLAAADPTYAATLHPNNIKRVARALAYCTATGKKFSAHNAEQKNKKSSPLFDTKFFVLTLPREMLYARINARTVAMFNAGFTDEVRTLLARGYHKNLAAMQGIGYKEVTQFLHNEISLDHAVSLIQQATRNYAKRQETWFRNQVCEKEILKNEKTGIIVACG
jgi:tRNA dimethylallyltransferase